MASICGDCEHKKYILWPGIPYCEEQIVPLPLDWESCLWKEKRKEIVKR